MCKNISSGLEFTDQTAIVIRIEENIETRCTCIKGNNWSFFPFERAFVSRGDVTFKLCLVAWTFSGIENAKEALVFLLLRVLLVDIVYCHAQGSPCFCC